MNWKAALRLCLEPAAIEQLPFEGCEETFAHRIVVGVADLDHPGARWRGTRQSARLTITSEVLPCGRARRTACSIAACISDVRSGTLEYFAR